MKAEDHMLTPTYKCGICHDTGYVLKKIIVPEYDRSISVNVGEPCPNCKGKIWTEESDIPKIFSEADMSKFRFEEYSQNTEDMQKLMTSFWKDYEKWELSNKGLFLWSNTKGSGKSFLACCLAVSVREKHRKKIKFITAVDYLQLVKESYKLDHDVPDKLYGYLNCDLLIIDDLGSEKKGEWQNQELFRLIDRRLCNGKMNIVTSNYPLNGLKCDGRIVDRLGKMCIPVRLPEISIRVNRAQKENEQFIKAILKEQGNEIPIK